MDSSFIDYSHWNNTKNAELLAKKLNFFITIILNYLHYDVKTLTFFHGSLPDYNWSVSKPNWSARFHPEKVLSDRLKFS